jgi:hypothetical protein
MAAVKDGERVDLSLKQRLQAFNVTLVFVML